MRKKKKMFVLTWLVILMAGACRKTDSAELPAPSGTPAASPVMSSAAPTHTPLLSAVPTPAYTLTSNLTTTPPVEPTGSLLLPSAGIPLPTHTPTPSSALVYTEQIGEKAWFYFYEDKTAVISGTGTIWDVNVVFEPRVGESPGIVYMPDAAIFPDKIYAAKKIIIEEGITHIGNWAVACAINADLITLPSTLQSVGQSAFYHSGHESTVWVGLNPDIEMGDQAFGAAVIDLEEFKPYTATPTYMPSPTPTPLPDPDHPKLVRSVQMGDDIIFEFWNHGYLYVKGSGTMWDQSFGYQWYDIGYYDYGSNHPYPREHQFPKDFCDSIEHIVIEEGITDLGSYVFGELKYVKEIQLPSTIEADALYTGSGQYIEGYVSGLTDYYQKQDVYGYYEGKKFVVRETFLNSVCFALHTGKFLEQYEDKIEWK